MTTERERMLAGELYLPSDPELEALYRRAQRLVARFNTTDPDADDEQRALLRELFGHLGEDAVVKPSLRCDYGVHVTLGAHSFVNFDCVFLDCNRIDIGEHVLIAPGVHVYTATHPLDRALRRGKREYALPVKIGDGAWIGGGAIVCPGVTIGENTVVGAGSVVTRDLPANVFAAGNPCRVIRAIDGDRPPGERLPR